MAQRFLRSIRNQWIGALALFLVLTGGTALALTRNSVGAAQLKPNSVKASETAPDSVGSPEVTNGSLLGEDFATGQLPAGAQGPQGDPGPAGSPDTPQQVLDKLAQVDGSSSGLDADTLDGADSGELARVGSEPWHDVGAVGEPGFNQSGTACAWRNVPTPGFNLAGFFRDRSGVVHLKGFVQVYDNAGLCADFSLSDFQTRIFDLPPGYRPEGLGFFPGVSGPGGFARIDVWANGEVHVAGNVIVSDAKQWVSLEGISFRCGPSGVNGCP